MNSEPFMLLTIALAAPCFCAMPARNARASVSDSGRMNIRFIVTSMARMPRAFCVATTEKTGAIRAESTRMNCVTVPQIAAATCPGFWTKCCVLPACRVNHETNATEEGPIRLFSSWNNLAEGTAVKMEAYV